MMRDGKVVVVDFKLSHERPEYHEQVRRYVSLMRRMGHTDVEGYLWMVMPNRVVKVETE